MTQMEATGAPVVPVLWLTIPTPALCLTSLSMTNLTVSGGRFKKMEMESPRSYPLSVLWPRRFTASGKVTTATSSPTQQHQKLLRSRLERLDHHPQTVKTKRLKLVMVQTVRRVYHLLKQNDAINQISKNISPSPAILFHQRRKCDGSRVCLPLHLRRGDVQHLCTEGLGQALVFHWT